MRRLMLIVLLLGCIEMLTWPVLAQAETAEPVAPVKHSLGAKLLSESDATVSDALAAESDVSLRLRGGVLQQARAFSLRPGSSWPEGAAFKPVPRGTTQLGSADMDSVTWLSQQFFNIGNRLSVIGRPRETDMDAERAAYQLAIWSFSGGVSLDKLTPNRIVRRSIRLASEANNATVDDRRSPIGEVSLSLASTGTFAGGERLVAHLQEIAPQKHDIPNALIRFAVVNKSSVRMLTTDDEGNATLDLPNTSGMLGEVKADWLARQRPGTVLQRAQGYAILYEPLITLITSESVIHAADNLGGRWKAAALRLINKLDLSFGPFPSLAVSLSLLLGIPAILAAFAKKQRQAFFFWLTAEVLAFAVAVYIVGRNETQDFRPGWAKDVAETVPSQQINIQKVSETTSLSGEHPGAFAGSCTVDSSDRTAWLSARNQGVGEMLAITFEAPVLLSGVRIVPGWFDTGAAKNRASEALYNNTGKPAAIQFFSDTGRVYKKPIPPSTYAQGPEPIELKFGDNGLAGRILYIRVTEIEGDIRTYTAITSIEMTGAVLENDPAATGTVAVQSISPVLTESVECGSS